MKKALFLLLFLTGCTSCAVKNAADPVARVPQPVDASAVMRLMGRWHVAHACPVNGNVLTAAHVVQPYYTIPMVGDRALGYSWSDMAGNSGFVAGRAANLQRDLGVMRVTRGTPWYYRNAKEPPEAGDILQWLEYSFQAKSDAYAPSLRAAKLIRRVSGHLVLDGVPSRGASGSCLFNSKSEVVGIIVWSVQMVKPSDLVGVAVSVAGPWWPSDVPGFVE